MGVRDQQELLIPLQSESIEVVGLRKYRETSVVEQARTQADVGSDTKTRRHDE